MRKDIQALRGIAVLLVVLYHADLFPIRGGYLGVDIFFVISGYLIVGLIMRDITANRFSIKNFYWRRAKRLAPASATVLFATAVAASFLLTPKELDSFLAQLAGAVTFTANVVLWGQTGYFGAAAEMKPLLHMWSLSVEEQFYLVVPATLLLIRRDLWGKLILVGIVASLLLCVVLTTYDWGLPRQSSAAFYLLPARAWQLGLGALGLTSQ